MNNTFSFLCLDCSNEFYVGVPDLLESQQQVVIGDLFWCGRCKGHRYECYWGLFYAGSSADTVGDILKIWKNWASSYGANRTSTRPG